MPLNANLRYLYSTFLPSFRNVCEDSQACPWQEAINHITVVSVSKQGKWGALWEYVSGPDFLETILHY